MVLCPARGPLSLTIPWGSTTPAPGLYIARSPFCKTLVDSGADGGAAY